MRHRLLRRALPAQRHEVLGALSAQKMLLTVMQRRAAVAASSGADWAVPEEAGLHAQPETLAQVLQMQQAAQQAVAAMRVWDGVVPAQATLPAVLAQADLLARQACAMAGHRLVLGACERPPQAPTGAAAEAPWPMPGTLYGLLGLVFHAVDHLEGLAPAELQLTASAADGGGLQVVLRTTAGCAASGAPPGPSPAGAEPRRAATDRPGGEADTRLDADDLLALVQELGGRLQGPHAAAAPRGASTWVWRLWLPG